MQTTVTLDDLLDQAHKISGLTERSQLLRQALLALLALVALLQRESAHHLALLGGSGRNCKLHLVGNPH